MSRLFVIVLLVAVSSCGASQAAPSYAPPPMEGGMIATDSSGEVLASEAEMDRGFSFGKSRAPKSAEVGDKPSGAAAAADVSVDQRLVKNAWLTIKLKNDDAFAPAVKNAESIARKLDGYVANQSRSSISFKVPTGRLDEALAALAELGKVTHRDVTTVDVTANYVDLAIRIDNLKKVRARLQELVQAGQNVQEILEVEKELARTTTQLEALEGQMRLLQNQTAFATVSVTFEERVRPGPVGWVFYGLYHGVKWLFVWD